MKVPVIETVHNGITNETLIHFIYSVHNIWGRKYSLFIIIITFTLLKVYLMMAMLQGG